MGIDNFNISKMKLFTYFMSYWTFVNAAESAYDNLARSMASISDILESINENRDAKVYTKRTSSRPLKRDEIPFSEDEFKKMMESGDLGDFLEKYNIGFFPVDMGTRGYF